MPGPAELLGQLQTDQVQVGELLPEVGRVADRVVLELAHHRQRAGAGADATDRLPQHLLLGAESQVQHPQASSSGRTARPVPVPAGQGIHRSPRRSQGLSSPVSGSATVASQVVFASPSTDTEMSTRTHPHPASSTTGGGHHPLEHHGVAGEDRAEHPERHPTEAAVGTGPVGEEPLEPRCLVGRVEEDVPGAVALDGEILVVVHGAPVPRGERAEDHRGGGHRIGELGQPVTHAHLAVEEAWLGGPHDGAPPPGAGSGRR